MARWACERPIPPRYEGARRAAALPIPRYDEAAADWHGRERARLARRGSAPPSADGQIAAIAAVNNLVLVTSNLRDFRHFQGLRLEDWRRG